MSLMEASIRSGESGSGRERLKVSLMRPARPNRGSYMKPHIRVATTAGRCRIGMQIETRKKALPCSWPLSIASAVNRPGPAPQRLASSVPPPARKFVATTP